MVSKESLYGPMKSLASGYDHYIDTNDLDPPTIERYRQQHRIMSELIALFDADQGSTPVIIDHMN